MEDASLLFKGNPAFSLFFVGASMKSLGSMVLRKQTIWTLLRLYPGVIREVLRRRRLSFWYKTSRSCHHQTVWAYADRHSIEPGQSFRLMMSAGPGTGAVSGHFEIFRIGYYGDLDRKRAWQGKPIEIPEYGMNNSAAAIGPGWPAAIEISSTGQWQTGYHSIDFVERNGRRHEDIAFMVVTAPQRKVDVLVKLATTTYQAYNRWGGHNFYLYETPASISGDPLGPFESDIPANRGDMVSFDRPTVSEFWEWEYFYVLWLERLAQEEGFSVGYATNFDLVRDRTFTSDCKLLIHAGHDEYWSREEFDYTHDRIFRQGGNTMFLGANIAYWQVRYADINAIEGKEGRQLICFKSTSDPIRYRTLTNPDLHITARFRENARRPESMLLGVAYQSNLSYRRQESPRFSYYVESTDLPFFDGTGYEPGEEVGEIVGHEWDNRDPEQAYGCPGEPRVAATDRLWHPNHSQIDPIPRMKISTVFSGDVTDLAGRKGRAEAAYFESEAGARVFSSGTIRWSWGLGKARYRREKFRRFNRNLLLHCLEDEG